ncbi:hypothetical protein JI667_13655 [Bacillus sp. NTK074B]|uniref:hypothetical protein n=1 Tax=Bacillus sp. NTK074B TaxID=2802174 RepID=UPI001A8D2A55|nr:hypothetical protein [Bacillus sp. NTK074B]
MKQNAVAIGLKIFAWLVFFIGCITAMELDVAHSGIFGMENTTSVIWLIYLFTLGTTLFFLGLSEIVKLNQQKINQSLVEGQS